MAKKTNRLSEVVKGDLSVVVYLIAFGLGTLLSQEYLTDNQILSVLFGAATNYILFRIKQELKKEGYVEALRK